MIKICSHIKISSLYGHSFLTDPAHLNYIKTISKFTGKRVPISSQFTKTSPELLEVIEEMLQFNPYMRPTTAELLKHRVFDKIRLPTECVSKYKFLIDMDTNEHKQDYLS